MRKIFIFRSTKLVIGVIILFLLIGSSLVGSCLSKWGPYYMQDGYELKPPSKTNFLGTDEFGRDLLARVLYGIRISLTVGILSVMMGGIVGNLIGWISGYLGGIIDDIFMRFVDAILAYPAILVGIAVAAVLGPGYFNTAIAVAFVNMPRFARLSRSITLSERERDYVKAAKSLGNSSFRTLFYHIVPNTFSPILVQMANSMAAATLLEAGLGFLGLGAQPPMPSLGSLLRSSLIYMSEVPGYAIFPGIVLTLLIFSLNIISEGARDLYDPKYIK